MERIPILKLGDLLVVTVPVDMHDRLAFASHDLASVGMPASRRRNRSR